MHCQSCGSVNAEDDIFCGRCGHKLKPEPSIGESPAISGPSLLGLSSESETDSADYLLEDDEPKGHRRLLLFLLICAIVGGVLMAARWWRAVQVADSQPALSSHTVEPPAFAYQATSPEVKSQLELEAVQQEFLPNRDALDQIRLERVSEQMRENETEPQMSATRHQEQRVQEDAAPKPTPSELEFAGEQYLFATGRRQNCQKALSNFESAAQRNNTRAMVRLGELYASGRCVKQDHITAYNWFRKAKNANPKNPSLDANMDRLWQAMSRSERSTFLK